MIFDEIPTELKEYIFSYVSPNDWISTGKVSNEWLELTLGCIKKFELCHLLILSHLAEFINEQRNTNYRVSHLLTFMPRLVHVECICNSETFWIEISPISHKLKRLDFKPQNDASFDWNNLDINFNNLAELHWEGSYKEPGLLLRIFDLAPKLEKVKVTKTQINDEWRNKIPRSVKHIILKYVIFTDEHQCSVNFLCQDASALETFSVASCMISTASSSEFFNETPRLKKLELQFNFWQKSTSMMVKNAFRNCRDLKTVKVLPVIITESWRRLIPENVKSINFCEMKVQEDIRRDFSLDWLFQNYACLQSLQLRFGGWTGFDSQKFYATENLKKLYLDNYGLILEASHDEPMYPFSDICVCMIRGSHLIDVEICKFTIDVSWRHIFPPTIRRLTLKNFRLSEEVSEVFSPQFICENPFNIENLVLVMFDGDLPAMNLNAFTGMQMLRELNLDLQISGHCFQSILTHCSGLTDLLLGRLTAGALINIPRNVVLPSLRKLKVKAPVDQPSLLLQHFPNVRTIEMAIVPLESSFSTIMNALQVAETVELKIRDPSWDLLSCSVQSIDDTKYKYFGVSVVITECKEFSFYWSNSELNACSKLLDVFLSSDNVLWINNYPSSPLLRNLCRIPSSMDELSQRYHEIMAPNPVDSNDDIDYDADENYDDFDDETFENYDFDNELLHVDYDPILEL